MKNRVLCLLTALVLLLALLPLSAAGADEEAYSYWDAESGSYRYTDPHYGIVLGRQMNVRNKPSTGGTSFGQIKNGQPVKILGIAQNQEFYMVELASCGIDGYPKGAYGFAKASLIKMDPEFIATTKLTNLYATPWSTEFKNGEQSNRFFLIIAQYNNWYAVQTMEGTPGTSFIRSQEVGQYTPAYHSMYVVTWEAPMYEEYQYARLGNAKRFSVGALLNIDDEYALLVFNEGTASEQRVWIHMLYVAPIIN